MKDYIFNDNYPMTILHIDMFLDGGTVVVETNKGMYYIDSRIKTTTKGKVYTDEKCAIPAEPNAVKLLYKALNQQKYCIDEGLMMIKVWEKL